MNDNNTTVIAIETKDLVGALVGLGFVLGAYVAFRVHTAILKNAKKNK